MLVYQCSAARLDAPACSVLRILLGIGNRLSAPAAVPSRPDAPARRVSAFCSEPAILSVVSGRGAISDK